MTTTEQNLADHWWMARAVRLAAAVFPPPHPNPRVGCVIVSNDRLLGEGAHSRAGEPHAEALALADCSDSPCGATAYVTLEPCSHFGRTPPCADALIEAGLRRIVIAHSDPSSSVDGRGIERLRAAGLEVSVGLLEEDARALNRGYLHRSQYGRPWVTAKLASSLDARTALACGESRWITSAAARADVHRQRSRAAALISSEATVGIDDPLLNARPDPPLPDARQPLRVVLDRRLSLAGHARLFSVAGAVLILHGPDATLQGQERLTAAGAELCPVAVEEGGRLSPAAVLELLAERQVNSVWLEAGATLIGSWMQGGWLDELIVYMAPHLLGEAAQPLMRMGAIEQMSQRRELYFHEVRRIGKDLRITLRPR